MPRKTSSQQATSQQATALTEQASHKRKASQIVATVIQPQPTVETVAAFTNNITFNNEDGRSDSKSEVETFVDTAVLAPGIGRGTQSFSAIPDILQPFTSTAQKIVTNYTYYRKPLLTPGELLLLIQHA
ncbi:hypothetical protein BGX38DRAFT_1335304 [Terfezia claveryi]|nr:hypothetical protein BGX38DRAFT_1335304 [Terfezia claveryi]